jgi:hypothetical protein
VSGFSQGKFALERDEETGEAFVTRAPLGGAELVRRDGSTHEASAKGMRLRLEDLIERSLQIQEGGE